MRRIFLTILGALWSGTTRFGLPGLLLPRKSNFTAVSSSWSGRKQPIAIVCNAAEEPVSSALNPETSESLAGTARIEGSKSRP